MLRTNIEDVYSDARSCRVLSMVAAGGLATVVPTRAPGDARYQQHHDAADVDADATLVCLDHMNPATSRRAAWVLSCSRLTITTGDVRPDDAVLGFCPTPHR